jgi:hypothetical protein
MPGASRLIHPLIHPAGRKPVSRGFGSGLFPKRPRWPLRKEQEPTMPNHHTGKGNEMATIQEQATAMIKRMDAYLHGESAEATAIIKDTRELVDVLRAQVGNLMLAEEGAAEAFGVVVQEKRDLEVEVSRLQSLLDGAYASIRKRSPT